MKKGVISAFISSKYFGLSSKLDLHLPLLNELTNIYLAVTLCVY